MTRLNRLAACLIVGSWAYTQAQTSGSASVAERYLFAAANVDRGAHGLPPLALDKELSRAALDHAREMASRQTISHQFTGEAELAERAALAGVRFSTVTENVAEATDASVIHDLWMQSAGHRANLLDSTVDAVGIAVIQSGRQFYAVEDFARTVPKLSLREQEAAVAQLITATGVTVAPTTADARRTCSLESGYAGPRKPWFTMRFTGAQLSQLPAELGTRLRSGNYHEAIVAACPPASQPFTAYAVTVLLYP